MSILKSNTRTDSALLDRVYSEAEKVFKGTLWEPSVMSRFKRIITKLKQEGS
jgi:spore coat polysaccharide biosynthesis protein SpsF (cytidylyltransferase family)